MLIQLDADVTVVGESRSGNVVYGGTPRVEGAEVTLPGGVFVRVSEDVARELGVLPDVKPNTPPPVFGAMTPPATLTPGRAQLARPEHAGHRAGPVRPGRRADHTT